MESSRDLIPFGLQCGGQVMFCNHAIIGGVLYTFISPTGVNMLLTDQFDCYRLAMLLLINSVVQCVPSLTYGRPCFKHLRPLPYISITIVANLVQVDEHHKKILQSVLD